MMAKQRKNFPAVLLIIDGWGRAPHQEKNPIELAQTKVFNKLWEDYPHTVLGASGTAVGLLPGQDGNSEAGHLNIGAGRIVEQDVLKITKSINDGTFFKNAALEQAAQHVKSKNSTLHVMGLLSDEHSGHANPKHLDSLLELFRKEGVKKVYLHLFTDGRDTPKYAALGFAAELEKKLQKHEKIVTLMGRFYGMDRKKDWSRTKRAYDTLLVGNEPVFKTVEEAIRDAYENGESDEFLKPRIIASDDSESTRIQDDDTVVFFNLRSDRARQLTKSFVQSKFNKLNPNAFRRKKVLKGLQFVAMTDFGPDLENILTAYPSIDIEGSLPMALKGYRQLYIAESEKFAHITYFLNGGYNKPVAGETRVHVPSPNVKSYDEVPEMAVYEITNQVIDALKYGRYDFIGVNFANADMIGHTGNLEASIKAVQAVDECVGKLAKEVLHHNGILFITADHGNVEEVINAQTGDIDTEHSTNPVPFIIVSNKNLGSKKLPKGVLGHVAPTILDCLEVEKPWSMELISLLRPQIAS